MQDPAPETKTDAEIVALTLRDPEYLKIIIDRYKAPLGRYVRRILRGSQDEIDVILQDIFVKVYQNLNDFDQDLSFSSWIYRIARNETIDEIRRKKRRPASLDVEDDNEMALIDKIASDEDILEDMDKSILRGRVMKVVDMLDPKYREVLILRFFEDKDYSEISDILKKPAGTVATLLSRAKKQFKEKVKEADLRNN